MLDRSLIRRRLILGAQILAGVAAAFSIDLACAQSPAARSVYNTASTLGTGGFTSNGSQAPQGINAFGSGSANSGMGGSKGFQDLGSMSGTGFVQSVNKAEEWKSIQVDSPEYVYRGHEEKKPITSLSFYPPQDGSDSYLILSASCDKTAKIWLLEGKYDQETAEWFVTNGRLRKTYKDVHRQGLTSAVFSPDYKYVLTSSYDQVGRLWNIGNQENIRAYLGAKDRLWSIAVADSGQYVAAACNDGRIYFWEPLTVKKLGTLPNREDASKLGEGYEDVGHEGPVFDVAFSPDGNFAATAGADGTVRMWNLNLQRQVAVIKASEDKVYSVKFSQDGGLLLTGSRDKTARLFNATTGEEVCRYVGHTGAVHKAEFAGSYVATASDDGTARLWTLQATNGSGASSDRMGAGFMGSAGSMGPAMSGDLSMGSDYPEGSMGAGSVAKQAVVGKPVRDPGKPKGTELACFNVSSPVFSVAVSDDLVYFVTGSADGLARVWRVPGNARYYGDSPATNGMGNNNGGMNSTSGFGSNPMADPNNTLNMGDMSGVL